MALNHFKFRISNFDLISCCLWLIFRWRNSKRSRTFESTLCLPIYIVGIPNWGITIPFWHDKAVKPDTLWTVCLNLISVESCVRNSPKQSNCEVCVCFIDFDKWPFCLAFDDQNEQHLPRSSQTQWIIHWILCKVQR